MYTGFNLSVKDEFKDYEEIGRIIYGNIKKEIEDELSKFILPNGRIDGSYMQESWFPQISADIFISHSHLDEDKAFALAGWLYTTFNLKVFIDSCVWGSADALLKKIDDEYCKNENLPTYSYEKRNFSTSHVHTMLSTALFKMIDKTESIIFLNTPNSINTKDVINKSKSPWIYLEVGISQMVRKKAPTRPFDFEKKGYFENAQALDIEYKLDMNHLGNLTSHNLFYWEEIWRENKIKQHPLDTLYLLQNLIGSRR